MKILFWGSILFCLAFLIHITIWKFHLSKRQAKVILQIFIATLISGLLALWVVSSLYTIIPHGYALNNLFEYIHIALFVVSLAISYMLTYNAVELESPSLQMVIAIAKAGVNGLDRISFDQIVTDNYFMKSRLEYLILDKMVFMEEDKYHLTSKGELLVRICLFYRKLLNITKSDNG